MKVCEICGKPQEDDLFSFVTQGPLCSVCTVKYGGRFGPTKESVKAVREELGLKNGEYLKQDNAEEARRILGRD